MGYCFIFKTVDKNYKTIFKVTRRNGTLLPVTALHLQSPDPGLKKPFFNL